MSEKYYTLNEAAKVMDVSRSSVYNWVGTGRITCTRTPGGKLLFEKSYIDNYENQIFEKIEGHRVYNKKEKK